MVRRRVKGEPPDDIPRRFKLTHYQGMTVLDAERFWLVPCRAATEQGWSSTRQRDRCPFHYTQTTTSGRGLSRGQCRLAQSATALIFCRPLSRLAYEWLDGRFVGCTSPDFAPRGRTSRFHRDGRSGRSRPMRTPAWPSPTGWWTKRRHRVTRARIFSSTGSLRQVRIRRPASPH